MKFRFIVLILTFSLGVSACSINEPKEDIPTEQLTTQSKTSAIITLEKQFDRFSSGSGMSFYDGYYYAIGDDDPYLWKFDENGTIIDKWTIWDTSTIQDNRIPKKIKPDFEAISFMSNNQDNILFIFTSGSKPIKRDYIIQFDLKSETILTTSPNAIPFYNYLRNKVFSKPTLNIEGAAYWNEQLVLLNRSTNTLITIQKEVFFTHLDLDTISELDYKRWEYQLPTIQKDTARFSGASLVPGTDLLLFSASVEQTEDWVEDGGILGSFIGIIDLSQPEQPLLLCEQVTWENNSPYLGKIEALEGIQIADNQIKVIAITDNDDGKTNLLHIDLTFR